MYHTDYQIRWKNFRGFKDTGWVTLKPLTILIGPNNSGKSSLITPLLLFNQTISSKDTVTPLVTRGPLANIGTYKELIFNHDVSQDLFLGVRFHYHEEDGDLKEIGNYPPGTIELTFNYDQEKHKINLKKYSLYDVFKRRFFYRNKLKDGGYSIRGIELSDLNKYEKKAIKNASLTNFLFSPTETLSQFYTIKESENIDEKQFESISDDFSDYLQTIGFTFSELRSIFEKMSYIGPLRERPQRYYEVPSESPKSVGANGENTPNLLNRNFSSFKKELNKWIKTFEFGDKLTIDNIKDDLLSINFYDNKDKSETNISDVGFGASQVLPLIVQTVAAAKDSLTIAEQPEIHLNPKLQCLLADLFIDMAKNEKRVIIETHSEHFLLRLRRLIADGEIDSDLVSLYFIEKKDGESKIRKLPLQENGHIPKTDWPKGFFQDSLRESLGLATAQSKHKKND